MVRLSKIYTKTGDSGQTMLGDGAMRPKHALRVAAYGEVDEANSVLGLAVLALRDEHEPLASHALAIQNDLFDVGADLCVPIADGEQPGAKLRITEADVARLEALIDELNAPLKALDSFVLPGGSEAAARLHHARTVTRRAERAVSALIEAEPDTTNPQAMIYLNRLSDLLFVMARAVNAAGAGDVLWKPGQSGGGRKG